MKNSLIICTRNRCQSLARCLEYVSRIQAPEGGWELIVVNSASTDGTAEFLNKLAGSGMSPLTVVNEPRPGLSNAKNAGAAIASGEILVFTDDDCYVDADLLRQVNHSFEDASIGYMGGRVLLFDPTDARETIKESESPELYEPFSYYDSCSLLGANMSVRSEVLRQVGGFDPLLGPGTALRCVEETDLFARASACGWKGVYDPRPTVYHHHGRKPSEISLYRASYEYGGGAYLFKQVLFGSLKRLYLKHSYWAIRNLALNARYRTILRYVMGAITYLVLRMAGKITPKSFGEMSSQASQAAKSLPQFKRG